MAFSNFGFEFFPQNTAKFDFLSEICYNY